MNNKYKKVLWSIWLTELQDKLMKDAITDKDIELACRIFKDIVKDGLVEKN